MKEILLIALSVLWVGTLEAQVPKHKPAYKIFTGHGKKISYRKLVKKLSKADLVFFGELHNNPIAHWLELSLVKDLYRMRPIVIGTEMLERDEQEALEDYLAGKIDAEALDSLTHFPINYKTDYKPIVDFAKENNIVFIGSNIPRRFARIVYRHGFEGLDTLSAKEKSWIAPLPIEYDPELKSYQDMLHMMGGHGGANLPKAQAIKDATMAHFILKNYEKGKLFFHFNGSYHSNLKEGIVWYVRRQAPDMKVLTIAVVTQKELRRLEEEYKGIADFLIVVDEDMTTTY